MFGDELVPTGSALYCATVSVPLPAAPPLEASALRTAPEGVTVMQNDHPDVPLYLGALDSHLNDDAYIVPGLGDAGDRQFGTV